MNKKMIETNNKKSHKKAGYIVKMKKSGAFFQANPWLENLNKSREIDNEI